jgi:hypothetical protein
VIQKSLAETPELPAPSAELVLLRTGAQAVIRTLGRKKGEKFLREWTALLADEDSVSLLFPARGASERASVYVAQRQALAWMRQAMPTLLATIPPE